jgi:hypothetical protein
MNEVKIIGFHGEAGSGKDASGAYLMAHGWARLSFASPIYDMLELIGFGRPTTQAEKDALIPEFGVSWRHAAQTLGTEWGRQMINPDLWLLVAGRMVRNSPPAARFVVTDVRFPNEAAMIRAAGGKVVHLKGRKADGTKPHASEEPLPILEGDIVVHNDTEGLDTLHEKLRLALRAWL